MALFVAICDDEKKIGAELESALLNMLTKLNIKCEIDVYFTGEALCAKMEDGAHYNLIFLDIEFAKNAINGVEVGKRIREAHRDNRVSIIYISWEMKYSMQLFDIRPLNFLIKPLDYVKVESVLKTYLDIVGTWSQNFTYKIGHSIYTVPIKDVVYLHSENRKLILHLADGRKEEFYGALKEVYQAQLQKFDFLLIHASYAVNYDYIAAAKYNEMVLITGNAPLPISKPRRAEIRETYCAIMEKRRV